MNEVIEHEKGLEFGLGWQRAVVKGAEKRRSWELRLTVDVTPWEGAEMTSTQGEDINPANPDTGLFGLV